VVREFKNFGPEGKNQKQQLVNRGFIQAEKPEMFNVVAAIPLCRILKRTNEKTNHTAVVRPHIKTRGNSAV
jgi:hypothetical protein